MLYQVIALHTLIITHITHSVVECKNVKIGQVLLSKKFGTIDKCSNLKAESVNANTICLSSCAKSSTDPEIKCNTSANTWNYDLVLQSPATFSTPKGHQGCSINESRYKCIAMRNDSRECDQVKHLNPGDHCYTSCGQEQCPAGEFQQVTSEDFKKGDCKEGYRVRCVATEKVNISKSRRFVLEMAMNEH